MGFSFVDSNKLGSKILGGGAGNSRKLQKIKLEFVIFFNYLHSIYNCLHCIYNYLHNIYILLGIINNLKMCIGGCA